MSWAAFRRLFWNPPPESAVPSPYIVVTGPKGIEFCGVITITNREGSLTLGPLMCDRADCTTCNPMTPERAAQINARYFQEKGYEPKPND